ncbi:AbrB/MazE/SpoVT family DNA-binding domain-containing protein [Pseudorhodoferax soli]|uniref:AbrB family looped-hinge helix DNA binding protein n=1 Tax=Pseudorhodoferax soli TaxID=545864 RepID=A0A368Y4V6_9BURK|nr:AbrB/MazE/SpoVT family DNA-binding domain-containing protein [Pseudorhodoferax soli]RCW74358.1 AbrB family looped-hinge helix DNA binding protein [Pseudorhodoferax soli]
MNNVSSLSNGRAVIPAALRAELDLRDGDQIIWSVRDGELIASTRRAQLRRAQQRFQQTVAKSAPSLSQELIADRRRAAQAE